jgi:thiamine biosynthesis lipoprotein
MNTIGRNMDRRSFLKLPALFPLTALGSAFLSEEHHFQYEGVIGTSLDLVVWTRNFSLAEAVCQTVLEEIDRLTLILNTRDPASEISLLGNLNDRSGASRELKEVLAAYDYWERRTDGVFSIRPGGANTQPSVDALGKAYIIDHAVKVARKAWPSIDGLLVNIGGDIVAWGQSCEIAIANPTAWYDNAKPIAAICLSNAAVATSGAYARGAHLIDGRTGQSCRVAAATVVAADAVTANALATTLCLTNPKHGLQLVESTSGAEALRIASGAMQRTSGFALLERPLPTQAPVPTSWPSGYQVTVTLPLTAGRAKKRPYVAVWVEDASGKLVRPLALWANKSKYYATLGTVWNLVHGKLDQFRPVTRATRQSGKYELVWDGLDNDRKPLPLGTYRITVETNQEYGTYAKQTGTIVIGDSPASVTLPATTNFDAVLIQYGPKQ